VFEGDQVERPDFQQTTRATSTSCRTSRFPASFLPFLVELVECGCFFWPFAANRAIVVGKSSANSAG
jgi:hypothetical protein